MADAEFTVTVKSNVADIKAKLPEAMRFALELMAEAAEGHAKDDCPVDTGLLRNSITWGLAGERVKIAEYVANHVRHGEEILRRGRYDVTVPPSDDPHQNYVLIGSNVNYSIYVELRDAAAHKVGKAHFLRDALVNHKQEYKEKAELALRAKLS